MSSVLKFISRVLWTLVHRLLALCRKTKISNTSLPENKMKNPGDDIVNLALEEVGYCENPPKSNKTKYGEWFGLDGVPWCGIFVSWVYHKAGFPLGNIGFSKGFAGTQTALKHFQETGEIVEIPVPGDIVLFDWQGDNTPDHTGIYVDGYGTGQLKTVEGNTAVGNDSNGGEVMLRSRSETLSMVFVHPKILDIQKTI